MRIVSNIKRWPRIFSVLVLLTVLELSIDLGLCRYIGRQSLGDSLFLVTVVVVLVALAAGITYKLLVSNSGYRIAAFLDRVEGRHVSAIPYDGRMTEDELNEARLDQEDDAEYEDEGCGDPTCTTCHPELDEDEDEEPLS
jgi:hypothetical protein